MADFASKPDTTNGPADQSQRRFLATKCGQKQVKSRRREDDLTSQRYCILLDWLSGYLFLIHISILSCAHFSNRVDRSSTALFIRLELCANREKFTGTTRRSLEQDNKEGYPATRLTFISIAVGHGIDGVVVGPGDRPPPADQRQGCVASCLVCTFSTF